MPLNSTDGGTLVEQPSDSCRNCLQFHQNVREIRIVSAAIGTHRCNNLSYYYKVAHKIWMNIIHFFSSFTPLHWVHGPINAHMS